MATKIYLIMEQTVPVYFPGQNINGRVKIHTKSQEWKNLSIRFNGFARVYWTERATSTGRRNNNEHGLRSFSAEETYYESLQQLWADPSQKMPSEASEFPFSFTLPLNCPPSFKGKHGQVMHHIIILLKSQHLFKDINKAMPFSVNAVVDLNHNPTSKAPQQRQMMYSMGPSCCKSGPLNVTVRVDKSGYAPGEQIVINAELDNKTKTNISGTKAKFIMETTYKATGNAKLEQVSLMKISKGEIAAGTEDMWENQALVIPPVPPSPLSGCNIIDVTYQLQFIVKFSGAHSDLKLTFPINLGTIPTLDSFPTAPEMPPASSPPPYGEGSNWVPFPGLEQYPQIPPPTYLQAIASPAAAGGKAAPYNVTDDSWQSAEEGEMNFIPSYVSYGRRAAPLPLLPTAPLPAQSAGILSSKSAVPLPSQSADPLPSQPGDSHPLQPVPSSSEEFSVLI